jgi:hypothetical protein
VKEMSLEEDSIIVNMSRAFYKINVLPEDMFSKIYV